MEVLFCTFEEHNSGAEFLVLNINVSISHVNFAYITLSICRQVTNQKENPV